MRMHPSGRLMHVRNVAALAFAIVLLAATETSILAVGDCSYPCDDLSATPEEEVKDTAGPEEVTKAFDLAQLVARLRATKAIGFFTKLSLKNRIDDLLDRFRQFHAGTGNIALPVLHEQFDLLLMKVITLLQDKDPKLFQQIARARKILWAKLADPDEFSRL